MKEAILLAILLYASVIDIKKLIVPTRVYIALFALSLFDLNLSSFIGMTICFLPFFAVAMGSPNAIGGGDVKLAAMIGLVLGIEAIYSLLIAVVIAIVVMPILQIITKKKTAQERKSFPLVPFLAVGVLITNLL